MSDNTTLHCLALRTVRHSDSRSILTAWSREFGRIAIAMPAGSGREARRRRALAVPMGLFEGEVTGRLDRDIVNMRDFAVSPGSPALFPSPVRAMVAAFVAEVLDHALRRSEADEPMTDFLFASARALGALPAQALPMFAPVFLFGLLHFAGVEPDLSGYSPGAVFDMRDARFRTSAPVHGDYLEGDECRALMALARVHYKELCGVADAGRAASLARLFFPSAAVRREILARLIDYYSIHVCPLDGLRSLQVLQEMANN